MNDTKVVYVHESLTFITRTKLLSYITPLAWWTIQT